MESVNPYRQTLRHTEEALPRSSFIVRFFRRLRRRFIVWLLLTDKLREFRRRARKKRAAAKRARDHSPFDSQADRFYDAYAAERLMPFTTQAERESLPRPRRPKTGLG